MAAETSLAGRGSLHTTNLLSWTESLPQVRANCCYAVEWSTGDGGTVEDLILNLITELLSASCCCFSTLLSKPAKLAASLKCSFVPCVWTHGCVKDVGSLCCKNGLFYIISCRFRKVYIFTTFYNRVTNELQLFLQYSFFYVFMSFIRFVGAVTFCLFCLFIWHSSCMHHHSASLSARCLHSPVINKIKDNSDWKICISIDVFCYIVKLLYCINPNLYISF